MKQLLRSLLVPAMAGALYAGPSLADPRDVLNPNHNQHGSIVRSTWTDGEAPASIAGRDTDVRAGMHAQTQAQMAAMGGASEAASENREANASKEKKAREEKKQADHPKLARGGDDTAESQANAPDSCGKTRRCHKDGERLHFEAKVAQQLSGAGEKPADTGSSKAQAKPAAQPGEKAAPKSAEKLHLPAKLSQQEQKPDMGSGESHASRSLPEARAERFTSLREPGSMSAHLAQAERMMRLPEKFYH